MCRRHRWHRLAGQYLPLGRSPRYWFVLREQSITCELPERLPMRVDADFTRGASRLIYPELPDPLTSSDLKQFFSPSYAEREWALAIARSPTSQVVLLVQLKVFQAIGRFLSLRTVPRLIFEKVRVCRSNHRRITHCNSCMQRYRSWARSFPDRVSAIVLVR